MSNTRYNFTPQQSEKSEIRLLYVSQATFGKDWNSFPHTHYFMEMFYIVGGKGYFAIEEEKYKVKKGTIILINPHVHHTEISDEQEPLEYIAIGAEGISFTFESDSGNQNHGIYYANSKQENIYFCFNRLVHEMEQKEEYFDGVCEHLLEILVFYLMRCSKNLMRTPVYENETPQCNKVKQYIENNYLNPITLEELAEVAYINKYYLVHSFTKAYGISPIHYLIEKKLQVCKELLATTNHSVLQISEMTGFSSQSYFAQVFKKACGITPVGYRKKYSEMRQSRQ
ncbi:MAG: AraC family transcriptional regulator [Cellulosilyticaceae bacterium]